MTLGNGVRSRPAVRSWVPVGVAVFLLAALTSTVAASSQLPPSAATSHAPAAVAFIPNRGQLDPRVALYAPGRSGGVFFTDRGPMLSSAPGYVTQLRFVGGSAVAPVGTGLLPGRVSYFEGSPAQWRTDIPTFGGVVYRDVWPGIDVAFSGSGSNLEYRFLVRPGADPGLIRLAYRGATSLALAADGTLHVATPAGQRTDAAPRSFQRAGGTTVPVRSGFRVTRGSQVQFGFRVGPYDRSRPLIIDPTTLVYGGFLGGSGDDEGFSNAVDASGNQYVTGYTDSTNFPVKVGPLLAAVGKKDAFVAKVDPSGVLVYAGFLGGSSDDVGNGIAVDGAGNAYVTGATASTDFPAVVGPDLSFNGGVDGFVAKVSADGTTLAYSGFLGGSGNDSGIGIAVDAAGEAYVTGALDKSCVASSSSSSGAPAGARPLAGHALAGVDVTLAKISAAGAFIYFACFGGSGTDVGTSIALDSAGNSYMTGLTSSSDFPALAPMDTSFNGGPEDAFVAKASSDGTTLLYTGYLGSPGDEVANGIAVDGAGNAYVTGFTTSSAFPTLVGPDLAYNGGSRDAFVSELGPSGALVYSGFLGGSGFDEGRAVAVNSSGSAVVTGDTGSIDFPVSLQGRSCESLTLDGFLASVSPGGASFGTSILFGGPGADIPFGVSLGGSEVYLAGATSSTKFPVKSGPDFTYNGGVSDAFLLGLTLGAGGSISPPGLIDFLSDQGSKSGALTVGIVTLDGICRYQLKSFGLAYQGAPAFSPDGSAIAVAANKGKGNPDVYLLDFTKLNVKPQRLNKDSATEKEPAFSPNGKLIAFASDRGNSPGQLDIWVMNPNGSHAHRLIGGPLIQEAPAWSPNGKTILFQGLDPKNGQTRIYTAAANGKGVHPLTSGPADLFPNWSPDGKTVAFQRSDQIFLMGSTGKNVHKLPHQPKGHNRAPAWSPDGERIAFFGDKSGNDDIFLIDANGSHLVQLTRDKSLEFFPRWLPVTGGTSSARTPDRPGRAPLTRVLPKGGVADVLDRLLLNVR